MYAKSTTVCRRPMNCPRNEIVVRVNSSLEGDLFIFFVSYLEKLKNVCYYIGKSLIKRGG